MPGGPRIKALPFTLHAWTTRISLMCEHSMWLEMFQGHFRDQLSKSHKVLPTVSIKRNLSCSWLLKSDSLSFSPLWQLFETLVNSFNSACFSFSHFPTLLPLPLFPLYISSCLRPYHYLLLFLSPSDLFSAFPPFPTLSLLVYITSSPLPLAILATILA